jgi:hypothetical protein
LRRRCSTEDLVAVRKAAEAGDDIAVADSEIKIFLKSLFVLWPDVRDQLAKIFDRTLLMLERFSVFERQIEEYSFDRPEF